MPSSPLCAANLLKFNLYVPIDHLLNEAPCGLETHTVEGFLYDKDYNHNVDLHITAAYDPLLCRWAPVLVSILFGRDTAHYKIHWMCLFGSIEASSWDDFILSFIGNVSDFSEALSKSFTEALKEFAVTNFGKTLQTKDTNHFYKSAIEFYALRQQV